jgi:hypothetical protein
MIRQRVNLRRPALANLVRALTVLLGLALIWYGLMVVLLAVKVAPHTVNSISAYRTLYNEVAGLSASDFSTATRLVVGIGGLIAFVVFLYLATQELPRPYLARGDVSVETHDRGATVIRPRAIERVAEIAAQANADVAAAAGRLGDRELTVSIAGRRAGSAVNTLTDVHRRVTAELQRHELPHLPINVTLIGYDQKTRRELS